MQIVNALRFRVAALLTLSLVAAVLVAIAPAAQASPIQSRVTNGTQVLSGGFTTRWSYVVALVDASTEDARDGQFCAGSLIAPQLVLTAAHCVTFDDSAYDGSELRMHPVIGKQHRLSLQISAPATIDVIAGRRTLSDTSSGTRIDVTGVIVHPKYDPLRGRYDMALLRLASAPASVTPVPIVTPAESALWGNGAGLAVDVPTGSPAIAGWGDRASGMLSIMGLTLADTLTEAALPIRSDAECDHGGAGAGLGYGRNFDPVTQLCVGTLDTSDYLNDSNALPNGIGACYGDSGGPLMVSAPAGGWRIAGITSWGADCGSRTFFSVYTRAAAIQAFAVSNPPLPVRNVSKPKVIGKKIVGKTVHCKRGTWTGEGAINYRIKWFSLGHAADPSSSSGTQITGARTMHLRLKRAMIGTRLYCEVTAMNASWTQTVDSGLFGPIMPPRPR